jgi:hypothetical protein
MTPRKASKKGVNDNPGKRVNLYLRRWDATKILELSKYVLENDRRVVSDSLIIRAALELAQTDKRFLAAYDEAAGLDQRFTDKS